MCILNRSRTRYGKVAAANAIDLGARDIWQVITRSFSNVLFFSGFKSQHAFIFVHFHNLNFQIESGYEYSPGILDKSAAKKEKIGIRRREKENVVKFLQDTTTDIEVKI